MKISVLTYIGTLPTYCVNRINTQKWTDEIDQQVVDIELTFQWK